MFGSRNKFSVTSSFSFSAFTAASLHQLLPSFSLELLEVVLRSQVELDLFRGPVVDFPKC